MPLSRYIWVLIFIALYLLVHNFWWPMHTHELILGLPSWFLLAIFVYIIFFIVVSIYAFKFWIIPEEK